MAEILLEANHVGLAYHELDGETLAVEDISFAVEKGEVLSIVGQSGCGKTSILSMIDGLMQPSRGKINLYGKSKPGYMLQRDHLLDWRTVEGNVLLGLQVKGMLNEETRAFTNSLLKTYGLSNFSKSYPRQLSGGMRQKVALIRTLACSPELLLLDEPAAGMNPNETAELMNTIRFVRDNFNMTILLIEHDMKLVGGICEELTVLNFGTELAKGKTAEVLHDPRVITAYIGEDE